MEDSKWASAALIIDANPGNVDQVTSAIEAQPRYRTATVASKMLAANIWCWHSGLDAAEPLEEHIDVVIRFIRSHAERLDQLRVNRPIKVSCGFGSPNGQGTVMIRPEAMELLSRLHIVLVLDLYPPAGEELNER